VGDAHPTIVPFLSRGVRNRVSSHNLIINLKIIRETRFLGGNNGGFRGICHYFSPTAIGIALRARLFTDFSETPNVSRASKFSCNYTRAKRYSSLSHGVRNRVSSQNLITHPKIIRETRFLG